VKKIFTPGCTLMLHKPKLAAKMKKWLDKELSGVDENLVCCHHEPKLPPDTQVITVCSGCDKRYRTLYASITVISFWEVLSRSRNFPFPDYHGQEMTILDSCPARDQARIHDAVRNLLARMNIRIVEPASTRDKSTCCGDNLYGTAPSGKIKACMTKRAQEMPVQDVVVYCASCLKAMHIGGKTPRHMVDLIFGETSPAGVFEPDKWHAEVDRFREAHRLV